MAKPGCGRPSGPRAAGSVPFQRFSCCTDGAARPPQPLTARTVDRALLLQLLGGRGGPRLGKQLERKRRFSQALALQRSLSGDGELACTTEVDWLSQQIAGGAIVQASPEAGPC